MIAGHELPKEAPASQSAALDGRPSLANYRSNQLGVGLEAAAKVTTTESAKTEPAAASSPTATEAVATEPASSSAGYDYVFSVNTSTNLYAPKSNDYPATYSFSVTAASGEIIYIKALSGGDLKLELASTLTELAGLLL